MNLLLAYGASAVALLALDMVWLGVIAKALYRDGIGHLMAEVPNWFAAGAFYLLYPVALMLFAVLPTGLPVAILMGDSRGSALVGGALFGFFAYATYDLSNLATLKNWPWHLALVDIAWGTLASAAAAAAGRWVFDRLA